MTSTRLNPLDAAWLFTESRATPNHVGGLLQFRLPTGAPLDLSRPPWECTIIDGRRDHHEQRSASATLAQASRPIALRYAPAGMPERRADFPVKPLRGH